ncbi:MAG: hypothetical protein WC002_04060 [Candidatus Muiribacteriota bacterium]
MDYREFITTELAENLNNIYKKMGEMNIINKIELDSSLKILEELRKEIPLPIKKKTVKNKK